MTRLQALVVKQHGFAPVISAVRLEKAEFTAPPGTAVAAKFTSIATFSEPGDYTLEVTANDSSGEGGRGFQWCWTNAQIKVTNP